MFGVEGRLLSSKPLGGISLEMLYVVLAHNYSAQCVASIGYYGYSNATGKAGS